MTSAEIQANRDAAAALVRSQLGLSASPAEWSYDQRNAYNKRLAAYYASHPEQFTDQDLATAEKVSKEDYQPLDDASFQYGDFVAETMKPAGDALQSIGGGVLSVANAAKWVIPLAAIGAGVLLFLALNRKLGSPLKVPIANS